MNEYLITLSIQIGYLYIVDIDCLDLDMDYPFSI
jgi:hypothetical protein